MKPRPSKAAWEVLAGLMLALLLSGAASSHFADAAGKYSLAATLRARTPTPRAPVRADRPLDDLAVISTPLRIDVSLRFHELREPEPVRPAPPATAPRHPPARAPPSRV